MIPLAVFHHKPRQVGANEDHRWLEVTKSLKDISGTEQNNPQSTSDLGAAVGRFLL